MKFNKHFLFGPIKKNNRYTVWSVFDASGHWCLQYDAYRTRNNWTATVGGQSKVFDSRDDAFTYLYIEKNKAA